jgi:hypothetical protein
MNTQNVPDVKKNNIIVHDFSAQLNELENIQNTCKKLLQTKHYQKLGEDGIHAIMARAKALGIHPFEALNGGFHVVQGKVGMSTEMMAALVRQRGHSIRKDPKSNSECVILHGKRADNGDEWTCKFDKEDAIAAGLWNSATWKKYPAVMLYNRCMSMLFRQLFPDLSLGTGYVEDELKEITRSGEYKNLPMTEVECEVSDVQPKIEAPKVEKLSSTLVNQLLDVLEQCSDLYKRDVNQFMAAQKIAKYEDLPMPTYDKILKRSIQAAEDYKKEKEAFVPEEYEEAVNE